MVADGAEGCVVTVIALSVVWAAAGEDDVSVLSVPAGKETCPVRETRGEKHMPGQMIGSQSGNLHKSATRWHFLRIARAFQITLTLLYHRAAEMGNEQFRGQWDRRSTFLSDMTA